MTLLGIITLITGGVGAFAAFLVALLKKGAERQGQMEERDAETQRTNEAKARADEVLTEQRDPTDAIDRLRKHDF